jgi:hypothetical protein
MYRRFDEKRRVVEEWIFKIYGFRDCPIVGEGENRAIPCMGHCEAAPYLYLLCRKAPFWCLNLGGARQCFVWPYRIALV